VVSWLWSGVISDFGNKFESATDVTLLARLVSSIEDHDDDRAPACEIQPVPWTIVDTQFGQLALNRPPVAKVPSFYAPQPRSDAKLRTFVLQAIKLVDEFFSLADREHEASVFEWIQVVNCTMLALVQPLGRFSATRESLGENAGQEICTSFGRSRCLVASPGVR
jgi:hypothetical protein